MWAARLAGAHVFLPIPPTGADVGERLDSFSFQAARTGFSHDGFCLMQVVSRPH